MANVNTLLDQRFNTPKTSSKMSKLATQSAAGDLSTFSGLFHIKDLNEKERQFLEALLEEFATGNQNVATDLRSLMAITAEVKAINHQAALLHGERIKRARTLLIKYRDGAFTSWLNATYGNRQTPYNFLHYYEFYEAMPKPLRPQIEVMPRQAIYTLASREGPLEKKRLIVEKYQGETKSEVLTEIRLAFPLASDDGRGEKVGETTINRLKRLCSSLRQTTRPLISKAQKKEIFDLIDHLADLVDRSKTR